MLGPVGLGGQACEEVGQLGLGIDAFSMAVANQRVEHGSPVAAFWVAHKKPVLFADGAGTDRILGLAPPHPSS